VTTLHAQLGDIAAFIRGINFKPDDVVPLGTEGSVGCMRTKNVQDQLECEDVWGVPREFVRRDEQMLKEGDILISSANSWNLVGKCSWVPKLQWPASFGGFVSVLRANQGKVEPRFLYYWFSSTRTQALLRSFGQKTTNISNLNIERCLNMRLPLPPLPEQRRIAAILDKADALRTKRREALAHLDELTQSIFIEMFGDPARNTKNLPLISLGDLGMWQSGGTPPRNQDEYFLGSISWFSSGELEGIYVSESKERITAAALSETSAKRVPQGALMLGMYDTAALKASIAAVDCSCNQAIAFATLSQSKVETIYVYQAITIGREYFRRLQRGVRQKNLNLDMIRQIRIPFPTLEAQKDFVKKATQLKSSTEVQNRSFLEFDNLFTAFQHRAFRGQL
jgi:type I restriction enzyme S subunit